jgi:hypothetical protein
MKHSLNAHRISSARDMGSHGIGETRSRPRGTVMLRIAGFRIPPMSPALAPVISDSGQSEAVMKLYRGVPYSTRILYGQRVDNLSMGVKLK